MADYSEQLKTLEPLIDYVVHELNTNIPMSIKFVKEIYEKYPMVDTVHSAYAFFVGDYLNRVTTYNCLDEYKRLAEENDSMVLGFGNNINQRKAFGFAVIKKLNKHLQ